MCPHLRDLGFVNLMNVLSMIRASPWESNGAHLPCKAQEKVSQIFLKSLRVFFFVFVFHHGCPLLKILATPPIKKKKKNVNKQYLPFNVILCGADRLSQPKNIQGFNLHM